MEKRFKAINDMFCGTPATNKWSLTTVITTHIEFQSRSFWLMLLSLMFCPSVGNTAESSGNLYVGAATISITPDDRVALDGQMHTRISEVVEAPCTATAIAIETRSGDQSLDQAVFVSCDLVSIRGDVHFENDLQMRLQDRVPAPVLAKLILNATHTHTGPVVEEGRYVLPESGLMRPAEYREFLLDQLASVIGDAWERRAPGKVAWGLGHAIIAHNRRAVYADGTAVMYGKTDDPNFRGQEGTEDHGVQLLYFWNAQDQLIATAINVACPAQEVEGRNAVNADFWHQVREQLREKHGDQLCVVAWCGAGGDQSPHLMYRKAAEERMLKLRGIDRLHELARRIVTTWEDVYQLVQKDQHSQLVLVHRSKMIDLPLRKISQLEALASENAANAISDPKNRRKAWFERVVQRYQDQEAGLAKDFEMELHAVRLGDVVIVNNCFELFTDYGVQMQARSPALQTFVIQLSGSGTYLPTERAVSGGGYSAVAQSNSVGPAGGQVLVEETVALIKSLWDLPNPQAENRAQ